MRIVIVLLLSCVSVCAQNTIGWERATGHIAPSPASSCIYTMPTVIATSCVFGLTFHTDNGTNYYDAFGFGMNGYATNAATQPAWTVTNVFFDGVNDAVCLPTNTLAADLPQMSIVMIITPQAGTQAGPRILSKRGDGLAGWSVGYQTNTDITLNRRMFLEVDYATQSLQAYSTSNCVTYGVSNRVGITWDGTTNTTGVTFYNNNVLFSQTASVLGIGARKKDATNEIWSGTLAPKFNRSYKGSIKHLYLFNRVLSSNELTQVP